jgi:uncharacterized protein YkwD
MRGLPFLLTFLLFNLTVDAQQEWFTMDAQQFWQTKEVNEIIDPNNFNRSLLEAALFHAGNEARLKKGKPALAWNPTLNKSARHQSELMANSGKLSHSWRKPADSRQLIDRVILFGGSFQALGENIAQFYLLDIPEYEEYSFHSGIFTNKQGQKIENKSYKKLAQECIDAWMNSKGHRENLLYPFQEIGTGVSFWVKNKKGLNFDIYLSQNFATP